MFEKWISKTYWNLVEVMGPVMTVLGCILLFASLICTLSSSNVSFFLHLEVIHNWFNCTWQNHVVKASCSFPVLQVISASYTEAWTPLSYHHNHQILSGYFFISILSSNIWNGSELCIYLFIHFKRRNARLHCNRVFSSNLLLHSFGGWTNSKFRRIKLINRHLAGILLVVFC